MKKETATIILAITVLVLTLALAWVINNIEKI